MKQANFFILGAPKCATTSLDSWLRQHPSIYLAPKEVHYFNTDHKNRKTKNKADYHKLFASATDSHTVVGETSVRYLYSDEAVANILAYNANAKFAVLLRNPIDMVYSWHNQLYLSDMEDQQDFYTAWQLQSKRLNGKQIPPRCREVKMLYYGKICALGWQLQRLYAQVPKERVHLIFFDDLLQNPKKTYQSMLQFLGVADDNRQNFAIFNSAKTYRWHFLKDLLPWLGAIKTKIGIKDGYGLGLLEFIRRKNIKVQKRPAQTSKIQQELITYFKQDILLLSKLTKRNLQHWIGK